MIPLEKKSSRIRRACFAGLLAVAINTVVLKAAPLLQLEAEAGGLLRLLRNTFGATFDQIGMTALWSTLHMPPPDSLPFWVLFHFSMGIGIAVFYVLVVEPFLIGPEWVKGFQFSLLPWSFNSAFVMPMLGKGFAASDILTLGGMLYFFFANGLYGVVLGVVYGRFLIERS